MMPSISDALRSAVSGGIISAEQAEQLLPILQGAPPVSPAVSQTAIDAQSAEESEQPRFIRGFHDILMTIGVLVAISGLWGIGSVFTVLPGIILLSEVLVRRQRLALPAVALTISLLIWIGMTMMLILSEVPGLDGKSLYFLAFAAGFPVVLAPYCWRYGVPLAFSALMASGVAIAAFGLFAILEVLLGTTDMLFEHRLLSASILLAAAILLFAVAVAYDMSDPARLTRRSDIAFWLHLSAAPSLLYGLLAVVFLREGNGDWWGASATTSTAGQVLVIVAVLMTIGLLIDRRAFVTSGLLSLGYAVWTIVSESGFQAENYVFFIMFAIGTMVLTIGVFWQALRRAIVTRLPGEIRMRLHPVR